MEGEEEEMDVEEEKMDFEKTREARYAEAIWPEVWDREDLTNEAVRAVIAVADEEQAELRENLRRLHFSKELHEEAAEEYRVRAEAAEAKLAAMETDETRVKPKARWADLFGIDPGFTGDLTTEEYLEANRGEA